VVWTRVSAAAGCPERRERPVQPAGGRPQSRTRDVEGGDRKNGMDCGL